MSQVSGVAGGRVGANRFSSSGKAALLLALAVVVGVVALQQIDDSASVLPGKAASSESAAQAPAPEPVTPAAPIARTPAEVKVLVANGIGVDGAAAKVAGTLQPIGYQLLKPGNTTQTQQTSGVQYAPGYEAEAQALATSIGLPSSAVVPMANPAPVAELQNANLIVIVGNELANKAQTSTAQQPNAQGTSAQTSTGQQGTSAQQGAQNQGGSGQSGSAGANSNAGSATAANGPLSQQ